MINKAQARALIQNAIESLGRLPRSMGPLGNHTISDLIDGLWAVDALLANHLDRANRGLPSLIDRFAPDFVACPPGLSGRLEALEQRVAEIEEGLEWVEEVSEEIVEIETEGAPLNAARGRSAPEEEACP